MAKLYDHKLGTGVLVADERVNELISTGNYSFIKGSSVHVVDEGGELYEVPPENAREALEAGYTYAPEEVVTEGLLRKEIEETPLQSAGYGLARAATLGLSDYIRPGVSKQELRLRRELQPFSSGAGELVGFAAGGLTGLAAKGIQKASANASARVIRGMASANAKSQAAKRVGSVLNSRIVRGAGRGAAEGLAVGTMYQTSEQLLDDPENYPLISDHIYAGVIFGAGAGGIISSIGSALRGAGGKFKQMRNRAYFKALDPKQPQLKKLAGKDYSNMDAVDKLGQIIAEDLDPVKGQKILKSFGNPKEMIKEIGEKKGQGLIAHWANKLEELKTRVEQGIKQSGQSVDDLQFDVKKIEKLLKERVAEPMKRGLDLPEYKQQYEDALSAIKAFVKFAKKESGGKNKLTFRQAEATKTQFGWDAYQNPATPEAKRQFMQHITKILKEESEEAIEAVTGRLSKVENFPLSTYAEFTKAKEIYYSLQHVRQLARGALAREVVNARFPLTSWITGSSLGAGLGGGIMASGDILTGGLVGAASFIAGGIARKYAKDSGDLLLAKSMNRLTHYGEMLDSANASQAVIQAAINTLVRGGAAATSKITSPFPDSPQTTVQLYKKLKKDIAEIHTGPETLYSRIDNMLPDVEGDQTINQELAQSMTNVVGFLQEKLPGNTTGNQQLFYDNDQVPPMNQILKFMRYVDIMNDPNKVLQYIIGGSLMPEHVEAIASVFPRLYQAQKEAIMKGLIDNQPVKLTVNQRGSLGRFLKVPTDRYFGSDFVQSTQSMYADNRQQQEDKLNKGMNIKFPDYTTATGAAAVL